MKVSPFKSVGAKLFYYMSALVLITVTGNSVQYIKTFKDYQTKQVQDGIQLQAESAADQIESAIDGWRSQLAVALPTLRGGDAKMSNDPIQRFVDSSPEYLAIQIWTAPSATSTSLTPMGEAFTSTTNDPRFEDKAASQVKARLGPLTKQWLIKRGTKLKRSNLGIDSVSKTLALPLMIIAARFDVANSQSVVWAVLTVWQTNLIKALPKSKFIEGTIVDRQGKVFTSPTSAEMLKRRSLADLPLTKSALTATRPSGFVEEFRDTTGRRRLGAFARLPKYNLTVLIKQDVEFAYEALQRNLLSTALWATLFILVSVMFSFLGATGITRGLRTVAHATSRIANGDFQFQIEPKTKDEVGMLGHAVNNMSRRIVELLAAQVEKARFEKELETAKMVQSTFFPKSQGKSGHTTVTGYFQPASECGGDLWGHFTIEEGVEFVFIADAMGHGVPAALVTAVAYSTTMTIADIVRSDPNFRDSPSRVLERLNRIIWEAVRGSISMTFFASIVDTRRGVMICANAGHNFPMIIPAQSGDPRAKGLKAVSKKTELVPVSLKLKGVPLGIEPGATFQEQEFRLQPGDKILYFTDGLIECRSPEGESWSRKRLVQLAAEAGALDAAPMIETIVKEAFAFFGTAHLDDDVTIAIAEISKDWVPRPEAALGEASTAVVPPPGSAAQVSQQAQLPFVPPPPKPPRDPSAAQVLVQPHPTAAPQQGGGGAAEFPSHFDAQRATSREGREASASPPAHPTPVFLTASIEPVETVGPSTQSAPASATQARTQQSYSGHGGKFKLKLPKTS